MRRGWKPGDLQLLSPVAESAQLRISDRAHRDPRSAALSFEITDMRADSGVLCVELSRRSFSR